VQFLVDVLIVMNGVKDIKFVFGIYKCYILANCHMK